MQRIQFLFVLIILTCPVIALSQIDTTGIKVFKGSVINGNKVTRASIIERELDFEQGDTLDAQAFIEACRQSESLLLNTRLFNFASVTPVFTENESVYAKIEVVERWYWWPEVIIRLGDPNFNTWWETRDFSRLNAGLELYRQNFRGRNEDLRVRAQFGYTRHFAISYGIPYISKKQRLGIGITAAYKEQEEITVATENNRRVFFRVDGQDGRREQIYELHFSYRPKLFGRHKLGAATVFTEVKDSLARRFDDYLNNSRRNIQYVKLAYQFKSDRRDNRGYPLDGDYFQLDIEQRGIGLLNRDGLNLTKFWLQYKYYLPLSDRWYYAAGLRLNSTPFERPPYYLQEGLGYSHNLRGYEYYIMDGQHFALLRSNFKFALIPRKEVDLGFGPSKFTRIHYGLYLNAFFDMGRVWDDLYAEANSLNNELQYSTGFGLDLSTYYDAVLRVEWAYNRLGESGFFLHFVQPI